MTGRLAGKVALVTGAGSVGPGWGNGRAAAVLFAREGAQVVVVDRDRAAAAETARLIGEEQGEALNSIFSFLGLDPLASSRSKDRNVVPYERTMNWQEKVFLFNLFADDIAKLEQLLGWDCSDWKL